MEQMWVPVSISLPASSSNMGSPNASLFLTLKKWAVRPTSTTEEKFEAMLAKSFAQFEGTFRGIGFDSSALYRDAPDSKTVSCHFTQSVASITVTTSNGGLAARVAAVEAGAASASSGAGSASSWNLLGSSDGSTATGSLGSHGQGSSDDSRNTRRRLDTFSSPEEEHARRAVFASISM